MDEVRFILRPVLLGGGAAVFGGIKQRYSLELLSPKSFKFGNVLLIYKPTQRKCSYTRSTGV
jgi:hypothetical protein